MPSASEYPARPIHKPSASLFALPVDDDNGPPPVVADESMYDSRMLEIFEKLLARRAEPEPQDAVIARAPVINVIDRTQPRICTVTISELSWPSDRDKLSLASSNSSSWSATFRDDLTMSHPLIYHIEPRKNDIYAKPKPDEEPIAYANWIANDATVVAYAKIYMTPAEAAVYKANTIATVLWTAITTRHRKRNLIAQFSSLRQLLSFTLMPGDNHTRKIHEMSLLNERMWEMGTLTEDDFLCIVLVRAMGTHYRDLRLRVMENLSMSTKDNPYTSKDILELFELKAAFEKDDVNMKMDRMARSTTSSRFLKFLCVSSLSLHTLMTSNNVAADVFYLSPLSPTIAADTSFQLIIAFLIPNFIASYTASRRPLEKPL